MASNYFFLLASIFVTFLCVCRADPHPLGSDLVVSAKAAAHKAQAATRAALSVVKSLDHGANKGKAETCIENYNNAIDNLAECLRLLNSFINREIIIDVQTKGSAALTDVVTCDDEFGSLEPGKLKQASADARKLISSFLAIVNGIN